MHIDKIHPVSHHVFSRTLKEKGVEKKKMGPVKSRRWGFYWTRYQLLKLLRNAVDCNHVQWSDIRKSLEHLSELTL